MDSALNHFVWHGDVAIFGSLVAIKDANHSHGRSCTICASPTGGVPSGSEVSCSSASLALGDSIAAAFVFTPSALGNATIVASAKSSQIDPDTVNNRASSVIDITGSVGTGNPEVPHRSELHAAYPNPFHRTTTITFDVASAGPVQLEIYNVLGRRVGILQDGDLPAGKYERRLDGSVLPSGVYFYRLRTNDFARVRTLILLR